MNPFKKLAGQTAIYGLPTIVGRLLNYFLVPLYTYQFAPSEFGVVTELYSYVSLLMIVFTYGMETSLFRFSQTEADKKEVYSTTLTSLAFSSLLFLVVACSFASPIAELMRYGNHSEYVIIFAFIIAIDAFASIPFAKLREEYKAKRFAFIKSVNIAVNIVLNLFFIGLCKELYEQDPSSFLGKLYNPEIGIGYIFISNLAASAIVLLLLIPEVKNPSHFNIVLWKKMMRYSLPLLVAGLAGMVNETLDRILLKYLLPDKSTALAQVGIYGACYKVSILMTIFIQTYRYAAEPFFFSTSKEKNSKELYSRLMTYFVIACSFIFLATMVNIDLIQYFIGKEYRVGLPVVPILLIANLFLGIFLNLSIWYKLGEKTHYGAYLTIFGAVITIVFNILWIPRYGFMGSAWATLLCYVLMTVASYFIGNKHFNVNYDLKRVLGYLSLSLLLFLVSWYITTEESVKNIILKNMLLIPFVGAVFLFERKRIKTF